MARAIPQVVTTCPVSDSGIQATSFDRLRIAIDACSMAVLAFDESPSAPSAAGRSARGIWTRTSTSSP